MLGAILFFTLHIVWFVVGALLLVPCLFAIAVFIHPLLVLVFLRVQESRRD